MRRFSARRCQSHLPALDDYPQHVTLPKLAAAPVVPKPETTPKVTDVVGHIQCELAKILNTHPNDAPGDQNSREFLSRLKNNAGLGLADIVADGLLSLDKSALTNVYPSSGPMPPPVAVDITRQGCVSLPMLPAVEKPKQPAVDPKDLPLQSLRGTMIFAPQSGVQTQGSVTFSGIATIDGHRFVANWMGTILPPNSFVENAKTPLMSFTLSGPLIPYDPADADLKAIEQRWGFNPTVTLSGTIPYADPTKYVPELKLAGIIAPATNSDYARATQPIRIQLTVPTEAPRALAAGASPAAKGGPSASSSGGTSFGSLVDFVLVYGINGSPSFTWKHLKTITGAGAPFINAMRTRTDSMAITFVAACRNDTPHIPLAMSYWDSVGVCDQHSI